MHVKHTDGHFEYIPFFSLPSNDLNDVIAPSCYSCFDYPNAVADLVVGYMGVPYKVGSSRKNGNFCPREPDACNIQPVWCCQT